jgi:GTP-sensing pleiotropic transcriptional regulator CodY
MKKQPSDGELDRLWKEEEAFIMSVDPTPPTSSFLDEIFSDHAQEVFMRESLLSYSKAFPEKYKTIIEDCYLELHPAQEKKRHLRSDIVFEIRKEFQTQMASTTPSSVNPERFGVLLAKLRRYNPKVTLDGDESDIEVTILEYLQGIMSFELLKIQFKGMANFDRLLPILKAFEDTKKSSSAAPRQSRDHRT